MAVVYRHLDDPGPFKPHQGRQKAVQSPIHLYLLQHVSSHHLQGAAGVIDMFIGKPVTDEVADTAADFLRKGILPVAPPAVNHVVLAEVLEQRGDIGRVVLQISVHGNDNLTGSRPETGTKSSRLAPVLREGDTADQPGVFPPVHE